MARRRFRRQKLADTQVMMAPLLDAIFILLLFFMLVNRFLAPSINVDLPRSVSAEITEERSIQLSIARDENVYIGKTEVPWENLVAALTDLKNRRGARGRSKNRGARNGYPRGAGRTAC